MMKKDILKATHQGELDLNGFKISSAVLEDGTRVLVNRSLANAFGIKGAGAYWQKKKEQKGALLPEYLSAKYLEPFIPDEIKLTISKPIPYINLQGIETDGVPAQLLADLCDIYIKAGEKGAFKNNTEIPENAYQILLAFSKVGIIALVDEVTGYQETRDKDALRQFLEKFMIEDKGRWVKTFPDEFFEAIFKMKGWNWQSAVKGQKPGVVGRYINNYVWSRIAPGVMQELNRLNPKDEKGKRKAKNPQFINVDFGHPKLKEHLNALTLFAKAVGYNWGNWQRMVERALPRFNPDGSAAQEIDFPEE